MYVEINNKKYKVNIIIKKNKHTYIRVDNELNINVSTNRYTSKKTIVRLLEENKTSIESMINRQDKHNKHEEETWFLGKKYDKIILNLNKKVEISGDTIFIPSEDKFDKWLKKYAKKIFAERLEDIYKDFEEKIPFPKLKVRKMKTRWGVCNKRDDSVTLNLELIKKDLKYTDYVIVHELSHFIHFDHSKNFWLLVSKYCPEYKRIRKELKE